MRSVLWCLTIVALSASCLTSHARAEEKTIPLEQLPKAVSDAVKKMFPKAEMLKASEEKDEEDDDEIVYEVTVKADNKNIDITVDNEGEIELLEKEIALKELPKAVSATLTKMFPKDTPKSAEAVYEWEDGEEELEFYEVQLKTPEGKVFEAKIKNNGKVVKENDHEDESEEKEEKE